MRTAVTALVVVLLAAPARAAGCLSSIEDALRLGKADAAAACFDPDAGWLDEAGPSTGTAAVRAGLGRLWGGGARPEGPLRWTRLSTGTWLVQGLGEGAVFGARETLVVLDLSPGPGFWSAARVYRGARPWPEEWAASTETARTAAEAADVFDRTFGAGDVAGWLARWAPDAVFTSVVGPFAGPEVGDFFRHQAERYEPPHIDATRDHGRGADGALAFEGTLRGRCREGGTPFAFPFIMRIVWRAGKVASVYEAFSSLDDGCGPFWTSPR